MVSAGLRADRLVWVTVPESRKSEAETETVSQQASQLRLNVGKSQASGKLFEKSPYLWRKALIRCAHVSMCDTCTVVWVTQHSALATSHQPIHPTVRHSVAPRFVTTPVRCCARWGENANVNRQTLLRIGSKFMGWVGSAWMGWDDVLPYSRSRISLVSCSAGGVAHWFFAFIFVHCSSLFRFFPTHNTTHHKICVVSGLADSGTLIGRLYCARVRVIECMALKTSVPRLIIRLFADAMLVCLFIYFFSLQFNCCQCDRPKKAIGWKYYPFDNFLKYASSSAKALCRPCSRQFSILPITSSA